jgi:hypothetical protein
MIVICVCVWFCISRDMLMWLSLCSTIFCMIFLLTCKAWRTNRHGLAKRNSNSLANQFVSRRIPDVSLISIRQVKLCQIVGDELFCYLAYLLGSWQSTRFAKENLANSWRCSNLCLFWCNLFMISHILPITKATLVR